MNGERIETVTVELAGGRLDRVLAESLPALSRTRLKALILSGSVSAGGRTILDPGYRVKSGEALSVNVPPPEPAEPEGETIPLSILHEDSSLVVLDKPAGLVVHPAAGYPTGTLVNALIAHCGASLSGIGGVMRPGIVHRLDKDTSGVMVVAKTDRAHKSLSAQFADHGRTGDLERGYFAFVWGVPDRPRGTIDAPIDRHPHSRDKMAVRGGGREAITHWEVKERYSGADGKPVASPDRVPARNRPHPPDPGPSRPYRPSDPGRRNLWHRLPHQGNEAAGSGARGPRCPWQTGSACLSAGVSNIPKRTKFCNSGRNFRPT